MDLRWNFLFKPFEELLVNKTILEIAPYDGWFRRNFLNLPPKELHVVELNPSAINVLRGPKFSEDIDKDLFTVHDADIHLKLYEFAPKQFEVIICSGFLYHTPHVLWITEGIARLKPEYVFIETFGDEFGFLPEDVNGPGMRQSDHKCVPVNLAIPKLMQIDWFKSLGYEILQEVDTSHADLSLDIKSDDPARNYFNLWKKEYGIWFKRVD